MARAQTAPVPTAPVQLRMDRRALVQWMIAAGGMATLERLSVTDLIAIGTGAHQRSHTRDSGTVALDAHAALTVTVAAEHIIPASDTPGATQAGVTVFIDTMFNGWYPLADRARFLVGLADLDTRSRARSSRAFVDSAAPDQLALLQVLDDEVNGLRAVNASAANAHWFAMLKFLTVWGYCTSEVAMRDTLNTWPLPMRYDGNATVAR